jgi:carbon storage regulator
MLVLTRQIEQEIVIGDTIRIKVLGITGNQVRLGIEAPAEVAILRRELCDEVSRENQNAAEVSSQAFAELLTRRRRL